MEHPLNIMKNYGPMNKFVIGYLMLCVPVLTHAQCDVVAVVFNTTICQADINIQNRKPGAKLLTHERQNKIEKTRLAQMIRTIAAENLLIKGSYMPSEEIIDSHVAFIERSKLSHKKQNKELIATIEHLLKTYRYTATNRKRLENGLDVFRKSTEQTKKIEKMTRLHKEDVRKRLGENAAKDLHARLKLSRRKASKLWVANWQMNKALYEKYGGRVIFQQAGIEPIDAYRALLRDIREKGALKILKKTYMDIFSQFERYLDMNHNYLSDKGDKYFDRPYWETADLDDSRQRAIDDYKRIPHI